MAGRKIFKLCPCTEYNLWSRIIFYKGNNVTIEEILKALAHKDNKFPREALEQAIAKKDEITPLENKSAASIKPAIKVGRNDPCPCGSGKKYKKCCGA
jgi:uncharacterized protein YecA (UPF0149 family)